MNSFWKAAIGAVIAGLLLEWMFDPNNWITAIVALIAGGIIAIVLTARARGETPETVAKEVVSAATELVKGDEDRQLQRLMYEQLVQTNQRFRLEGQNLSDPLQTFEALVDILLELVPAAMERCPSAKNTFDLKNLATENLPKLVHEFLDLTEDQRGAAQAEFQSSLNALLEAAQSAQGMMQRNELREFEAESMFAQAKFV